MATKKTLKTSQPSKITNKLTKAERALEINNADLKLLSKTVEKAFLKAVKELNAGDKEYISVLQSISETLQELKLLVEFDHERRLQAIEDMLNQ